MDQAAFPAKNRWSGGIFRNFMPDDPI